MLPHASHTGGKLSRGADGEFILTDVKLMWRRKGKSQVRDIELASAIADVEKTAKGRNYGNVKDTLDDDPRNGWTTAGHDPQEPHLAIFALAEPLELPDDHELVFVMLHRSTEGDANVGRFRISVTDQPGAAVRALQPMPLERFASSPDVNPDQLAPELRSALEEQFLQDHAPYREAERRLRHAERQLAEVKQAARVLNVMVLAERESPRPTHVLRRGVWDQKGDPVEPGTPSAILSAAREDATQRRLDRLDLARWLVARENPLTARVVVNHLWQMCFGAGLVRTPEDFGLQGQRPDHPELLDWLAVELMDHDWDLRHILRLIVTSETYCQSSTASPEALRLDPENRWLARGARFRLPSWMIRDGARLPSAVS